MTLLTITQGRAQIDYSQFVQVLNVKWPETTELPICTVTCNNQGGEFATVPLYSTLSITIPGVGTANFKLEKLSFGFTAPSGGGINAGHTVVLTGTAAPELLFLTEGNLDVVGTDLSVGEFNARGTNYVPYQSTNVAGSSLLDIGNLLTALLHTPQPNQDVSFRGRLGYDCTGAGVRIASGVDYLGGPLGFYIKGMWQVGLGSTAAQKAGLDLIRDVVTKNVIDVAGAPAVLDFYVDPFASPPTLSVFQRGSGPLATTFTIGMDPVQELTLPVDTEDVKNFVVYWTNAERQYPNGGDAWSNYSNGASMNDQWDWQTLSGSGTWSVNSDTIATTNAASSGDILYVDSTTDFIMGTPMIIDNGGTDQEVAVIASIQAGVSLTMTQNLANAHPSGESVTEYVTRFNSGTSIELTNASGTIWEVKSSGFNLPDNGYRILNAQTQNLTALNFSILRTDNYGPDLLYVYLYDSNGEYVYYPLSTSGGGWPFSAQTLGSTGAWHDVSLSIPQSGNGASDGWYHAGGSAFDFATSEIVRVSLEAHIGGAGSWFIDQIYFADNWQFSPVYSYNPASAIATTLTSGASAGDATLSVLSVDGFLVGQTLVVDYGNMNQETNSVTGIDAPAQTLILASNLAHDHKAVLASTTTGGSLYTAQPGYPEVTVNSTTGFEAGATVNVSGEVMTILSVTPGSPTGTLTMTTNFARYHYVGESVTQYPATMIGGTHDQNSIDAYDYRIFNFFDFYNTNGASDSASIIVSNILNSRKGKKSGGTIKVNGRAPQVGAIRPGSRFKIVDAVDVYRGGAVDSTIDSWIADVIEYNWDASASGGFVVTYTVEPYYSTIVPGSPDTNPRNLWKARNLSELLRRPLGGEISLIGRTGIANRVVRDASGNIIGYVTDK